MKTCVYRAYDERNVLVYVGLSRHWPRRWVAHRAELLMQTARLEIDWYPSLVEAQEAEAEQIRRFSPLWNRQQPSAPDVAFRCQACGMTYASIQTSSESVRIDDRELWSIAGLCNDMSGHGGMLERPCRGRVVSAVP